MPQVLLAELAVTSATQLADAAIAASSDPSTAAKAGRKWQSPGVRAH